MGGTSRTYLFPYEFEIRLVMANCEHEFIYSRGGVYFACVRPGREIAAVMYIVKKEITNRVLRECRSKYVECNASVVVSPTTAHVKLEVAGETHEATYRIEPNENEITIRLEQPKTEQNQEIVTEPITEQALDKS